MCFQRVLLILGLPFLALLWWWHFSVAQDVAQDLEDPDTMISIIVATLMTLTVAGLGIIAGFLVIASQALLMKGKGVLGEHTLDITDEGLVESTEVNRSLHLWSSPFRIRETSRYAFIFVSDCGGHIIPMRRVPLEGSVPVFLVELRWRIRQAQEGTAANAH